MTSFINPAFCKTNNEVHVLKKKLPLRDLGVKLFKLFMTYLY